MYCNSISLERKSVVWVLYPLWPLPLAQYVNPTLSIPYMICDLDISSVYFLCSKELLRDLPLSYVAECLRDKSHEYFKQVTSLSISLFICTVMILTPKSVNEYEN